MRITKWITGAALAAALLVATPHKADAQVTFGIGFGHPAPVYGQAYGPVYGQVYVPAYNPYYAWHRDRWIAPAPAYWQWRHEHWDHRYGYRGPRY